MNKTTDNKVRALDEYSKATGIPLEDLLSIYLVVKDDLFFILNILASRQVKFPSEAKLKSFFNGNYSYLELSNSRYETQCGWVRPKDIQVGDTLKIKGKDVVVNYPISYLLGRYYLVIKEENNG